jgi:hypothetical protein
MMTCEQIQVLLNDYIDDELSAADAGAVSSHCFSCECCSDRLEQLRSQRELIQSLPVPHASANFEKRVIENAVRQAHPAVHSQFRSRSIYLAAAASILVALVLWLGLFNDTMVNEKTQYIATVSDQVQTINVAIDSDKNLEAVNLRVELSDNLELAGFGNKKTIDWTTQLQKGVNVISLPVVGIAQGKGDITTRIRLNGKEKTMRINTQYKLPDRVFYETDAVMKS